MPDSACTGCWAGAGFFPRYAKKVAALSVNASLEVGSALGFVVGESYWRQYFLLESFISGFLDGGFFVSSAGRVECCL